MNLQITEAMCLMQIKVYKKLELVMADLLSFPQGHCVYTVPSPFCHRVRETSLSQTRGQGRHFLDKCT